MLKPTSSIKKSECVEHMHKVTSLQGVMWPSEG